MLVATLLLDLCKWLTWYQLRGPSDPPPETLVSKLDASDHLYLHPSDSSNLTIVSQKLKATENYTIWSDAMTLALQVKNKLGFIDKTCIKSETSGVLARQWDRCNFVVLTWILNSISDELYMGQVFSKLVSDVWNQILHLPTCTCNVAKDFNSFNQMIKLMQFLMGLDSYYQNVRTTLLIKETLPSVKEAFAIVSRENLIETLAIVTIEKCFELIGYPSWMRSRGNRSKKASVDASCAINDSSVPITSLTNDQMTRLLNPLNDRTSDTPQSCNDISTRKIPVTGNQIDGLYLCGNTVVSNKA
uniref:Putative gag-polypeptide of LTR copia-type n=1 Tax=Helianthus annuus TaxID=4232 RepID=A0A251V0H2_HELAN